MMTRAPDPQRNDLSYPRPHSNRKSHQIRGSKSSGDAGANGESVGGSPAMTFGWTAVVTILLCEPRFWLVGS